VVSPASATKSAGRRSKICSAFESVARINEIFNAYRAEADRTGSACGPDQLAIRRNISVAASDAEARETSRMAKEMTRKVTAGDPRVKAASSSLLDAKTGFAVHDDEFIAGTPAQVAEQIIAQCRACGAGHILAILGRAVDEHRIRAVDLFADLRVMSATAESRQRPSRPKRYGSAFDAAPGLHLGDHQPGGSVLGASVTSTWLLRQRAGCHYQQVLVLECSRRPP
jgi:hypothetical protein